MSYILEALKKSSEERARLVCVAPPAAPALANAGQTTRRSAWWLIAGIGVGALAVVAFIGIGALSPQTEADRSPPPLPVAAEPAPAPAQLDDVAATASLKKLAPKNPNVEIPPAAKAPDDAAPQPKKPAAKPARPAATPTAPAETVPSAQAQSNSPNEMPPDLLKQVLAIPISAHIYSSKAAERMVIIDGRGVREGDSLPSGVLVEQITPTGISVSYKGYRANKPVN
ncbi:MAG: gspB [Proteobacteria bacterium]|nr:gspB [Pseudomonadota bacterium]